MAMIRKRGSQQWQAAIRKKGYPQQSKTFPTRAEAEAWAAVIESEMVRGVFVSRTIAEQTTLDDVLKQYETDVAPTHKGFSSERYRIRYLRGLPLAKRTIASLQPKDFADYRDRRLLTVMPATVERELTQLQQVIEHARREWGVSLPENPVRIVKRPRYNNERNRRLTMEEESILMKALNPSERNGDGTFSAGVQNIWLKPAVILALETAMRQGEIVSLRWRHVDLEKGTAYLPDTKNGKPRTVPLSQKARDTLEALPKSIDGRVFPITANALKLSWQRVIKRVNLGDLHFHDLRHEATSRLAKKVPNIIELAAITGHRDVNMLRRYYHVSAEELAKKIA